MAPVPQREQSKVSAPMQVGVSHKICIKCKEDKSADAFKVQKSTYVGVKGTYTYVKLSSLCRECMNTYLKAYREKHRKPKKEKVLNDHKEIRLMQRAPSWAMQKTGYEKYEYKIYPTCQEGHRYVGPECLPCKYALISVV